MNQAGIKKPYLPNGLSAHRVELDCNFCGGRLSINAAAEEKIECPFCRKAPGESPVGFFKQKVAISMPNGGLAKSGVWQHRYEKQKRWWMRRRFCEKKLEGLIDTVLTGNARFFAVGVGMAIVGGILAFVLGVA